MFAVSSKLLHRSNSHYGVAERVEGRKPAGHKNDLGSPVRIILSAFGIFIVSQFLAAFLVEAGLHVLNTRQSIDQSASAQFLYILLAEGASIATVLGLVRRHGLSWSAIGLGRKITWRDIKLAVAGFFAFYGLVVIASVLLTLLIPSFDINQTQDVGFNYLSTPLDQIIALIALVLLPPIGEEILMRGYLYSGLRMRMRFWSALLITSLLFGAAHLSSSVNGTLWAAGVDTFVLSVVLVYLRERTGALYAPIMVHGLNNLVAFFAHFHS